MVRDNIDGFMCFATAVLKKGNNELVEIIKELKPARKEALLKCAVTWNTNSRNSHVAQVNI